MKKGKDNCDFKKHEPYKGTIKGIAPKFKSGSGVKQTSWGKNKVKEQKVR